ncbi:winged helix-turn-helix domain-containing protein [Streptomyces lacrimifluminis]|uniref:Transcriptional regulator n=1 Tax=Streptomyces lacrimifluminis TaxID=1500077 RepID=A0A917L523_9ACTN|nr:helix-turn-helix domain-containing protein [Streptomyces lacrimifluminis]GGJ43466.1 transcriptional regulator [Streptomyces lacrimifluminis]
MLRVHFTAEDLVRVRVAAAPDPLWELTNSVQVLATDESALAYGEWRRLVRPGRGPADVLLAGLMPSRGYAPDFLTPALSGSPALDSAIDTVLSTPRTVLRDDLVSLAASTERSRPLPAATRALADGDANALRCLGTALHAYHRRALAPHWPHIRAQVSADVAVRTRAVLDGGADGLLASFAPLLRWRSPVLEAEYPVDRDIRLGGRGLLLQPSFFCHHKPVMLAELRADLTPVLVHPIQHTPGWAGARGAGGAGGQGAELGALLGRTRAAILEDVVTGRTTGELARRFGISGAAASQHTAVLRRAGLLLSMRRNKYVVHTITPTGLALLAGVPSVRPAPDG